MPHADSSLIPDSIQDKTQFWEHVFIQLEGLLEGQRNWVTNLANASSLVYSSLLGFPKHFGDDQNAVNWCGFYVDAQFFPVFSKMAPTNNTDDSAKLLLGPFCGKPACQYINVAPGKTRGVCADAFTQRKTLLVPEVDLYPGHIACDGETKSEIVIPLLLRTAQGEDISLGVFDLDCLAINGFTEEDKLGLEKIATLVVNACDW